MAQPVPEAPSEPETVVVVSEPGVCSVQAQDGLMMGAVCTEPEGHKGPHKAADGSWPR